jgi:hypothetical protein
VHRGTPNKGLTADPHALAQAVLRLSEPRPKLFAGRQNGPILFGRGRLLKLGIIID